ncbi:hypothetical protein EPI10_031787 [Gossypium australe]|uniref:Uncharacterized protein n=1 Tax=Gossypium australe TaxID=47621 RepID=A0A5B6X180_9ROSI|nr:hypothetical protein EPI10_031787 [Gossypium australe]
MLRNPISVMDTDASFDSESGSNQGQKPEDREHWVRRCPSEIQGEIFPVNLMELYFSKFDLVFGIDWWNTKLV